ncbi:emp24/gp25L/p24 family/GOLD domain-containing protein [Ditylenchus destructor]|uniref:Emp24/gp25L/p24 family/GOLD domain-containing protein n=1 Tax=Ditylenchus destructor TaxID=166010 RepID=A0AAD4MY75_9BILA|nr:emp24/gp25L/p24 family/GOLD domain-containing protein [Ditylenchus destructor]
MGLLRELRSLGTALLLLSLMVESVRGGEYDLTVEVPPGKFQCFFQEVTEKHKAFEIDYQVIDGGDLNINFMLILDYQICFDNSFSYQTRKVVFFEIFLYDQNGNLEEVDITKYAKTDPELKKRLEELGMTVNQFHDSFGKIRSHLSKVEYYQAMFRTQEARDRAIMTANNDRVLFWSVLNSLVLIGVGFVQVYMIRSLFEEHSKIGRALRR